MKVLHLITSLNRGGAENHLLCLIRGQLIKKHKVYIVYLKGDGYWKNYFLSLGVQVLKLNEINLFSQILTIKKTIKNEKIDIVHSHLPHMELLGYFSVLGNSYTKFIISKHVDNDYFGGSQIKKNSIISSIISLVIYSKAHKIIAISKSVKNFLIKSTYNKFKDKISVIYYGLDDFYIKKCLTISHKKIIDKDQCIKFGFIGRLVKQKQVDKLILSFSKLVEENNYKKKDIKLLIAGSGPEKKNLIKLANRLNISKNIIWINFTDDVGSIFNQIDVLCMNSSFEGLGLVMLEAMAYSKPIIGPNISAIPEVIKHQINGLLVQPENINDYTKAMSQLLNAEKRVNLSQNSLKILKQNFNYDIMLNKIMTIYNTK